MDVEVFDFEGPFTEAELSDLQDHMDALEKENHDKCQQIEFLEAKYQDLEQQIQDFTASGIACSKHGQMESLLKLPPPLTVEETNERINKRCDTVEEKIKVLETELVSFKEQVKRTKPGPTQEALKSRALRIL